MALTQGQVNEILKLISQNYANPQDMITLLLREPLNENYIISYIRKGLMTAVQYESTLNLLPKILLSFSKEILNDHLMFFMETVVGNRKDCCAKFKFLEISVGYISSSDAINKQTIGILIGKIIEKCISIEMYSSFEYESLSCLQLCLEFYPGNCSPFKNRLENHITGYLKYDKRNSFVIHKAGKCYTYLQQCGPTNPNSNNRSENWSNTFIKLISTIQELLKCLTNNQHSFAENNNLYPLKVDNGTTMQYFLLECRLESTITFARALIETKFNSPKVLKPDLIINLLDSCINNDPINETSASIESYLTNSIKERVEIQLFKLFRSFIAMLGPHLIPFSNKITKILLHKLNETKNAEHKKSLYTLIGYFVSVLKNNVSSTYHKRLVQLIMADIEPISKNVTLNVSNVDSLKARQKITAQATMMHKEKFPNGTNFISKEEEICISALDCLNLVFTHLNLNIKSIYLKYIYKTLCDTLVSIQNGINTPPYSSNKSIKRLYQVLVSSLEQTHPPDLSVVINLLKMGRSTTRNDEILNICTIGLMTIEKMCQPTRPLVFSYKFVDSNTNTNQQREAENMDFCETNENLDADMENGDDSNANIRVDSIECKSIVDEESSKSEGNLVINEDESISGGEELNELLPEARVVLEKLNVKNTEFDTSEDLTLDNMMSAFNDSTIHK